MAPGSRTVLLLLPFRGGRSTVKTATVRVGVSPQDAATMRKVSRDTGDKAGRLRGGGMNRAPRGACRCLLTIAAPPHLTMPMFVPNNTMASLQKYSLGSTPKDVGTTRATARRPRTDASRCAAKRSAPYGSVSSRPLRGRTRADGCCGVLCTSTVGTTVGSSWHTCFSR